MPNYILEVCVDSIDSARIAVEAGANRLEICGNLANGGGTTPSLGLIKCIASRFPDTPLMAMIRPRCGDFVYTDLELEVMKEDIKQFREAGIAGVVLGVLTPNGTIDIEKMKMITEGTTGLQGVHKASPPEANLRVTFHRAFDMTQDLNEAVTQLATIPTVSRVLTSGGCPSVLQSLVQLEELLVAAPPHLTVMPGSGVSPGSVQELASYLIPYGLREVHMSGGNWEPGRSVWRKPGMGMGTSKEREWDIWSTSFENVRAVRMILDSM